MMNLSKENHNPEWFRNWFDSPYYHMLYRHRDDAEAQVFLDNLLSSIQISSEVEILDLACGKGRHAIYLHSKGFQVTGVDLSEESIKIARMSESERLHFEVADMRNFLLNKEFGCVLNLFTSFGYFQDTTENLMVLHRVKAHLSQKGIFILDYFNPKKVQCTKGAVHTVVLSEVSFEIKKRIIGQRIVKEIFVNDHGQTFSFEECVQLFDFSELQSMLATCGMRVMKVFGSYDLQAFDQDTSERIIIIAENS